MQETLTAQDIKIIENFVDPDKAKAILEFLSTCEKPTKFKDTRFVRHIPDEQVRDIINEIRDNTLEAISEYFAERGLKIVRLKREHNTQLVRFSGEKELPGHIDMPRRSKWTPDITAIAYLNDNYLGGEIVFGSELDDGHNCCNDYDTKGCHYVGAKIEMKPIALSLVIFPSALPHETKRNYPIEGLPHDYRCSVPMFFTFKVEELWK